MPLCLCLFALEFFFALWAIVVISTFFLPCFGLHDLSIYGWELLQTSIFNFLAILYQLFGTPRALEFSSICWMFYGALECSVSSLMLSSLMWLKLLNTRLSSWPLYALDCSLSSWTMSYLSYFIVSFLLLIYEIVIVSLQLLSDMFLCGSWIISKLLISTLFMGSWEILSSKPSR